MITIKIDNTDVSDYVIGCDRIPVITRNRDYSLTAEGFSFELSGTIMEVLEYNMTVSVTDGSVLLFAGFVRDFTYRYDDETWVVEADNFLLKLEDISVSHDQLHSYLSDTVPPQDPFDCTFDSISQTIYSENHGLLNDRAIVFETTGELPGNIVAGRYYYTYKVDNDNFKIREYIGASNFPSFTGNGTGSHSFVLPNGYLWTYGDNENAPNVQIEWLMKQMFTACGLSLDTTAVRTYAFHYDYTIQSMCLDENMLYALNQAFAIHYTKIDDPDSTADYSTSKITLWELFKLFCSVYGFGVKANNAALKQYKLFKNVSDTVTIPDSQVLSKTEKTVKGNAGKGYTAVRKYRPNRYYYKQTGETTLLEYVYRSAQALEKIEIPNSFQIFFYDIVSGVEGKVMDTLTYQYPWDKIFHKKVNSVTADYKETKFKTGTLPSNYEMVREVYYNPAKREYEITQEVLL